MRGSKNALARSSKPIEKPRYKSRGQDSVKISGIVERIIFRSNDDSNYAVVEFRTFDSVKSARKYLTDKPSIDYAPPRTARKHDRDSTATTDAPKDFFVSEKPGKGPSETLIVKGDMPYVRNYFFHVLQTVKVWDDARLTFNYAITKFHSTVRLWDNLVFTVCETMLREEIGLSFGDFQNAVQSYFRSSYKDLTSPTKKNKMALNASNLPPGDLATTWYAKTEFCAWERDRALRSMIPGGLEMSAFGASSAISKISASVASYDVLDAAKDPDRSWLLASKRGAKKAFSHVSFVPVSLENEVLKIPDRYKRALRDYDRYHAKYRVAGSSTSFVPAIYGSAKEIERGEESLALLCGSMALLVRTELEGMDVYTFAKDYEVQTRVLEFYERTRLKASNRPSPKEKESYERDVSLSDEQFEAVEAVRDRFVVNIVGLPGRGKSHVMAEICKRFENVIVVTRLASLACDLRKKIPFASTVHFALTVNEYGSETMKKNYRNAEILMIDEFEDIDDSLAKKLFYSNEFPNLARIVHVFDPMQIGPISPGSLATDFMKTTLNTEHTKVLKKQFRFKGDEFGISNVLTNDEALLRRKYANLIYDTVYLEDANPSDLLGKDLVFLHPGVPVERENDPSVALGGGGGGEDNSPASTFASSSASASLSGIGTGSISRSALGSGPIEGPRRLRAALQILRDRGCIFTDDLDGTEFKCIASTNAYKNIVNSFVEAYKNRERYAFYSGQPLTIVGANFKPKSLNTLKYRDGNRTVTIAPPPPSSASGKKDVVAKSKEVFTSEFTNGESHTVEFCIDYDPTGAGWISRTKKRFFTVDEMASYDRSHVRKCIVTTEGKVLCVHPEYIPSRNVEPGWAITVDKAKGRTYGTVLLVFDAKKDVSFFQKRHVHVAVTRASTRTYVLNTPEALCALCDAKDVKRFGLMRERLKSWWEESVRGSHPKSNDKEEGEEAESGITKKKKKRRLDTRDENSL